VCAAEDLVALHLCVHNLAKHILVREADYESVLGRVVFVLVLHYKSLPSIVVSLSLCVCVCENPI
jgi:hypothetical protein